MESLSGLGKIVATSIVISLMPLRPAITIAASARSQREQPVRPEQGMHISGPGMWKSFHKIQNVIDVWASE
jgi:hypothetical protein